jgi:dolichol kinase
MIFGHDLYFWIAVAGAVFFKMFTSERRRSFAQTAGMVIAAVFFAWAFTGAVLHFFSLNPEIYEIPVAALVALTGENVARWIVSATPIDVMKLWRGQK